MPSVLTMPKLSPTMESGVIVKWLKKEGDLVKASDVLFEVATDKATIEYVALDDGYLRKILVNEGAEAKVNDPVAILSESKSESIESFIPKVKIEEKPVSIIEKTAKEDKAPAPTPVLQGGAFAPAPPLQDYQFEWPRDEVGDKILASPLAKKIAKEKGIDLSTVKGTGPNERITSKDLDLSMPEAIVSFGRKKAPENPPGFFVEETLTPMRKAIGERLQGSKTFIPHFYIKQTVDVDELVQMRDQLKNCDIKLTFNDFIIRACAIALKQHPTVNSGFDSVHHKIIRFQTIDISIAVSMEGGLITPIIRHANYKNLGELSTEAKFLAKKAKEGKLAPHEYQGGSFTISNLGMYGIDDFTAVINPPQAAILAVGGIKEVAVVKDGKIQAGKTMTLTLSADHRVVDGSDGALFLQTVKKYLEHPAILLI